MSFKNIGKINTEIINVFSDIGANVDDVIDLVNKSKNINDVSEMFKALDISKEAGEFILNSSKYVDSVDDITKAVSDLSKVSSSSGGLIATLRAIGSAFKKSIISPMGLGATAILSFVAVMKLADIAVTSFDEKVEKSNQSTEKYKNTLAELSSLKEELGSIKDEIEAIQNKGTITLSDKADLQKLKSQRKELEAMIDAKERLAYFEQKEAAEDAREVLTSTDKNPFFNTSRYRKSYQVNPVSSYYENIDNALLRANEFKELIKKEKNILETGIKENGEKLEKGEIISLKGSIETYEGYLTEAEAILDENYINILAEREDFINPVTGAPLKGFENDVATIDSYTKKYDEYYKTLTEIQSEALSDIWGNDTFAKNQQEIIDQLRQGKEISIDDLKKDFPELVKVCDEAGISVESLREELLALANQDSGMTALETRFEDFKTSAISLLSVLDTVNAALVNSFSAKGLSIQYDSETGEITGDIADLISVYGDLEGFDAKTLFENTANGVRVNREALRQLQAQQEAIQKEKFTEQQIKLQNQLNDARAKQKELDFGSDDYNASQIVIDSLENQLLTVKQLSSAYEGATSAYQKWLDAQSNGEDGDMYREVSETMLERGGKLYKEGRYNTEEFRAIADYFSYEDLTGASMEQVVAAYENATEARKKFFTGDKTGIDNFMREVLEGGFAKEVENGIIEFETGTDEAIAQRLGLSVEAVQTLIRAATEYNDGIRVGDTSGTEDLTAKLEEAKSKLKELQEQGSISTTVDLDVDVSKLDSSEIENRIALLEKLKSDAEIKFGADSTEIKYVNDLLTEALAQKEQLETETVVNVKYNQVDLSNRPTVSGKKMQEAGWVDVEVDSTATVYTSSRSNEVGDKTVVLTPILPNGDVLSPDALDGYFEKALSGQTLDQDIFIREFNGENSIQQAELYSEALHRVQDAYYLGDDAAKSALNSIKEYSAEQLSSIDLMDNSMNYMEDSLVSLMDSMGLSSEYAEQFINVLSDMNLLDVSGFDFAIEVSGKEDIESLSEKIESIPDGVQTNIDIEISDKNQIDSVVSELEQIPPNTDASVTFNVQNQDQADALSAKIDKLNESRGENKITYTFTGIDNTGTSDTSSKTITVTALTVGQEQVDALNTSTSTLADKTVNIKANTTGILGVNTLATAIDNLTDKTITITTKEVTEVAKATGTFNIPAKASGSAYNVFNAIPAYANGNISLPRNETALVNEMGTEGLIRDGKFMLIPGGMHFQNLKKGDIVLSTGQVEALLNRGSAPGVGKAYAHGTLISNAYSDGSWVFGDIGNGNLRGSGTTKAVSVRKNNTKSATADEFKETLDEIEILLEEFERDISNLDTIAQGAYRAWAERNTALAQEMTKVTEEISVQQQAYNKYVEKANSLGLDSSWVQKLWDGALAIEDITDEDLHDKIQEFQDWADKAKSCSDAILELNDKLADLAKQRFENTQQEYEDLLSTIEHEIEMIEGSIDRIETQGYFVSSKMYNELAKSQQENLTNLEKEYASLQTELENAMASGNITRYSEDWYELVGAIQDVESEISDVNTALVETQNFIRELNWELFDKMQEMLSSITTEKDFLVDLMSDEKMFNSNDASITEQGRATLGLYAVAYNAYMSQSEDYAKEIEKINAELANDPNNTLLLDRRNELLESQRDLILAAEDEKSAIKDLAEEYKDTFLDAMDTIIDKKKQMFDDISDLYDFEKEVSEITKDIASLEKQKIALQGDSSESNQSRLQQIRTELEEQRQNLQETEYDKYIEDQQQMLDAFRDETEQFLSERIDNSDLLMQNVIDATNGNAESIKETLVSETEKVGTTLSESMLGIWGTDGTFTSVVSTYGSQFDSQLTTTNSILDKIRGYLANMVGDSDEKAESELSGINNNSANVEAITPSVPTIPTETPSAQITEISTPKEITVGGQIDAGSAQIYSYAGSTNGARQYFRDNPIYTVLGEKNGYLKVRHQSLSSGVTGWFKKSDVKAYKQGGLVDYTGLAWVDGQKGKPESFLDAQDTKNVENLLETLRGTSPLYVKIEDPLVSLYEKAGNGNGRGLLSDTDLVQLRENMTVNTPFGKLDQVTKATEEMSKNISNHAQNIVVEFDGDIVMNGVNDVETFGQNLEYHLKNNTKVAKIIQSDTLGVMLGKNSFEKYKY